MSRVSQVILEVYVSRIIDGSSPHFQFSPQIVAGVGGQVLAEALSHAPSLSRSPDLFWRRTGGAAVVHFRREPFSHQLPWYPRVRQEPATSLSAVRSSIA
jgi:hypothetical protein